MSFRDALRSAGYTALIKIGFGLIGILAAVIAAGANYFKAYDDSYALENAEQKFYFMDSVRAKMPDFGRKNIDDADLPPLIQPAFTISRVVTQLMDEINKTPAMYFELGNDTFRYECEGDLQPLRLTFLFASKMHWPHIGREQHQSHLRQQYAIVSNVYLDLCGNRAETRSIAENGKKRLEDVLISLTY